MPFSTSQHTWTIASHLQKGTMPYLKIQHPTQTTCRPRSSPLRCPRCLCVRDSRRGAFCPPLPPLRSPRQQLKRCRRSAPSGGLHFEMWLAVSDRRRPTACPAILACTFLVERSCLFFFRRLPLRFFVSRRHPESPYPFANQSLTMRECLSIHLGEFGRF